MPDERIQPPAADPDRTGPFAPPPEASTDSVPYQTTGATAPAAGAPPAVPGYDIVRELGRGGMGVVYEARQAHLGRRVALKLMLGGTELGRARFLAEGQVVASLKHPNVVEVYEYNESPAGPYIAMAYLAGGTYQDRLAAGLSHRDAASAMAAVARGVGAAHDSGVVHRDLKPGNVLLDADGTPKVADFGLAKRGTNELTQTGAVGGTYPYMAPEQARDMKFVGPPADVWSLGVMLYESLVGRRPFRGDSVVNLLFAIQNDTPEPPSQSGRGVPRDLETVCLKCLEKEPERRYATANELVDDLEAWLEGRPITARRVARLERAALWVRRKPTIAAAWALGLFALLVGAFAIAATALWRDAVREKGTAEFERGQAVTAKGEVEKTNVALAQQKKDADDARGRAEVAEGVAEKAKEELAAQRESVAYARFINLANAALSNRQYQRFDTLIHQATQKLRGWEWDYLHRSAHAELLELRGHAADILGVSYSRDGGRIATASRDMTAKIWDAESGKPLADLLGHTAPVQAVAFSPDGLRAATASDDGTVRFWDARTGASLSAIAVSKVGVMTVTFTPDGRQVITTHGRRADSTDDGAENVEACTVDVWEVKSGERRFSLVGHSKSVFVAKVNSTGTQILTAGADGTVRFWNAADGSLSKTIETKHGAIQALWFSSDGKRLLTGGRVAIAVKEWDVETGKEVRALKGDGVNEFSDDGRLFVTATRMRPQTPDDIRVFDTRTGASVATLAGHSNAVYATAFRPDGARIVTGSIDGARVWGMQGNAPLRQVVNTGGPNWVVAVDAGRGLYATNKPRSSRPSGDDRPEVWSIGGKNPSSESPATPGRRTTSRLVTAATASCPSVPTGPQSSGIPNRGNSCGRLPATTAG